MSHIPYLIPWKKMDEVLPRNRRRAYKNKIKYNNKHNMLILYMRIKKYNDSVIMKFNLQIRKLT